MWREATVGAPAGPPRNATVLLRVAIHLCVRTFLVAAVAAGGEAWRYSLLLRGRTEVLPGRLVKSSDLVVDIAGTAATVLGLAAAVAVVATLVRLHGLAALRAGRPPSRRPASVLARLIVPGWNIYGLGVVAGEIEAQLTAPEDDRRPRLSALVLTWWCFWTVDAVLVLLTLGRAFGRSEQSMADAVELHIFLDLAAAVVALLAALVLRRFRRLLTEPPAGHLSTWVVLPPAPTRGLDPPAPTPGVAAPGSEPAMTRP